MADRPDETARRRYWIEQMDAATRFMADVARHPVAECGERMASLRDAVSEASVEVVFSETRLADVHDRLYLLRRGLTDGFIAAARAMNERGWVLRVEDGYRTVDLETGAVQPIPDPLKSLHSSEEIRCRIREAVVRGQHPG